MQIRETLQGSQIIKYMFPLGNFHKYVILLDKKDKRNENIDY